VSFAQVKHHVPALKALTRTLLFEAVQKHRDTTRPEDYAAPYLKHIIPYLAVEKDVQEEVDASLRRLEEEYASEQFDPKAHLRKVQRVLKTKARMRRRTRSSMRIMMAAEAVDPLSLQELRLLFISLLRAAYDKQVEDGELDDREFLTVALEASLDFAEDAVQNGEPLRDWDFVSLVDRRSDDMKRCPSVTQLIVRVAALRRSSNMSTASTLLRLRVERSIAFMAAHQTAQQVLYTEFANIGNFELTEIGQQVLLESQTQYDKAKSVLMEYSDVDVQSVVSRKFCLILLESGVKYL
jgi:hypothetical protein